MSAVLVRFPRQPETLLLLLAVRRPSSVLQSGRRRSRPGAPGAPGPVVQAVLPTRTPGRHLEPPAAPVSRVRGVRLEGLARGGGACQRVQLYSTIVLFQCGNLRKSTERSHSRPASAEQSCLISGRKKYIWTHIINWMWRGHTTLFVCIVAQICTRLWEDGKGKIITCFLPYKWWL